MGFFELFLIGIGLSMDAFAVAICKGLGMERINKRDTLLLALFFGGFQALMPLTGYLLGSRFASYIERWDHWIAFVLLAFIGGNMIRESREQEEEEIEHGGSIRISRALHAGGRHEHRRAGRRRLVRLPRACTSRPPSRSSAARPLCSRSWAFGSAISSARATRAAQS